LFTVIDGVTERKLRRPQQVRWRAPGAGCRRHIFSAAARHVESVMGHRPFMPGSRRGGVWVPWVHHRTAAEWSSYSCRPRCVVGRWPLLVSPSSLMGGGGWDPSDYSRTDYCSFAFVVLLQFLGMLGSVQKGRQIRDPTHLPSSGHRNHGSRQ